MWVCVWAMLVALTVAERSNRQPGHVSPSLSCKWANTAISSAFGNTKWDKETPEVREVHNTLDLPLSVDLQCQLLCLRLSFITLLSLSSLLLNLLKPIRYLPLSSLPPTVAARIPLCEESEQRSPARLTPLYLRLYWVVNTSHCSPSPSITEG